MATEEPSSNRPSDSKFKQQKLDAWQPILTPVWVIGTFIVVGIIFIPVGVVLFNDAENNFEENVLYDSKDIVNGSTLAACSINTFNQGYRSIQAGTYEECLLTFEIDKDIGSDKLYLYYELDNFYQNHRRYVKSRSDTQLRGEVSISPGASSSSLETSCDPLNSTYVGGKAGNRVYYPCGLIANSYFNDGIQLYQYTTNGTTFSYTNGIPVNASGPIIPFDAEGYPQFGPTPTHPYLKETDIAWSTDLSKKFKNPTGANYEAYDTYQYLWQTYDQMSCYDISNLEDREQNCQSYPDLFPGALHGNGCAACPDGFARVYEGGIPPPSSDTAESSNGVRNEHFVVWMRTAALPKFRKLYAYVEPPEGSSFKSGDTIVFKVVPNFEVKSFDGKKSLVLGTTSPLGGKNHFLGIAYIVVGAICMLLALIFGIKLRVSDRQLGDPRFLTRKQQ